MKLTRNKWLRSAGTRMRRNSIVLFTAIVALLGLAKTTTAYAQTVSTTTVQGTVYLANGKPGAGTLHVSWPNFTTANGQAVVADSTNVSISPDGFVSVNLAPNQGAMPAGLYYTAVFYMSDGSVSTQYWVVPAAAQASLGQVQAQVMPAAQAVQAVNKAYVDQALATFAQNSLTASGGSLTGPLYLSGDPTQAMQAADKHYVDSTVNEAAAGALPANGCTSSSGGNLNCAGGIQSGTKPPSGAPAGTVSAAQIYSPKGEFDPYAFGAKGDGVTDDTSALQATVNAAGALGGSVVRLKAGVYKTSSTLVLPYAVQLHGAGNNNCGLGSLPPAGTCINYTGTGYAIKADTSVAGSGKFWQIKDLAIWGNNTTDSGIGILGTSSAVPSSYEINNVTVGNFGIAGIYIKGTSYGKIDHVSLWCTQTGPAGKIGMDIEPGALYNEVSYFSSINTQTCSGAGIKIAAGNMFYFNTLDLNNDGTGILIKPAAGASVFDNYFDNTNIHGETASAVELDGTISAATRIFFRNIVAGTAGASTSEQPIYAHGVVSADFDGLQIALVGSTVPTNAIYADCSANISTEWDAPNSGAGNYPQYVCNNNWSPASSIGSPVKQFRNILVWDWNASHPDMNTMWGSNYHGLYWNVPSSSGNFYGMSLFANATGCSGGPGLVSYGTPYTTSGGARNVQTTSTGWCFTLPNPSGSTGVNKFSMQIVGRIASNPSDGEPGLGIYPDSTQGVSNNAVTINNPSGSQAFAVDYSGNATGNGGFFSRVHDAQLTSSGKLLVDSAGYIADGPTAPAGNIVGDSDTQTLTNKSIAGSEINSGAVAAAYGGTGQNETSATGVGQWSSGTYNVSAALANGTTATTQSAGDNSTKVATTAYVASPGAIAPTTVTASGIISGGNDTALTTSMTIATTGFTSTGLVLPTVPANTIKTGRCAIYWQMSSTSYTATFGIGMNNSPAGLWGGSSVTYAATGTASWLAFAQTATAATAISTPATAGAAGTTYRAEVDFTLQTGTTNPVALTLYGEVSNTSATLTIGPGSVCYWLP